MEPYCQPEAPIYKSSSSASCIVGLFFKKKYCQNIVQTSQLPVAVYINIGVWIVSTSDPLTFTITCRNTQTYSVVVKSPFGILKLYNTCAAFNKHHNLPVYFENGNIKRVLTNGLTQDI